MKTIINKSINEIEIKNSRFITILIPLNDETKIKDYIDETKKEYPKATHYCYAYRNKSYEKSIDDGEPGGTAGSPLLNVLIKEDLLNILVIVVRYFGGVKLGAGGLVRAYTKSLTDALNNTDKKELKEGFLVKLTIDYKDQKQLDYILKDDNILDKQFNENIEYLIETDNIDKLNLYNPTIIEKRII